MSTRDVSSRVRERVWNGSIPLEIRLHKGDCRTYDDSDPYLIQFPRLSYLALLIPRLHAFFSPTLIYPDVSLSDTWLSHEDVPLKWHYPLGLLYDLYSGAEPSHASDAEDTAASQHTITKSSTSDNDEPKSPLPFRLTVHYSSYPTNQLIALSPTAPEATLHDTFMNAVKEADYLRTGTGKTVMFLSKEDSTQLWNGVRLHDFAKYGPINNKLLNPAGVTLRHVPIRLYLPHAAEGGIATEGKAKESEKEKDKEGDGDTAKGSLRVVQRLVPLQASSSSRTPQTLGMALNSILPSLFPLRRRAILAQPVLHGAAVPLEAGVEDLMRSAAYLDGWLHVAVVMMT